MEGLRKHFVTFVSPGTFVHEETTRPIDSWNPEVAKQIATEIVERYGARPFAFYFTTRERGVADLDSRVTKTSGRFYLGGDILTLADVEARKDEADRILIANMKCNGWERIVENRNSYKIVQPLRSDDVVLDFEMSPKQEAPQ